MIVIHIKDSESIEKALRRYKKKVKNTGIHKEVRERRFFEKPSIIRRNEIEKAKYKEKLYQEYNQ
ncbi:MAG: 30S ribosomal protein S21 [Bacteroidia bacterium]